MKTSEYKVEWIDSSIALEKACQKWHEGTCLTIDTEYDSFKRSYWVQGSAHSSIRWDYGLYH